MIPRFPDFERTFFFLVLFQFFPLFFRFFYVEKPECLEFSVGFLDNKILLQTLNKIRISLRVLSMGSNCSWLAGVNFINAISKGLCGLQISQRLGIINVCSLFVAVYFKSVIDNTFFSRVKYCLISNRMYL